MLLLLAALLTQPPAARSVRSGPPSPVVHQYGRFELTFTAAKEYRNPLEVDLAVEFVSPGGVKQEACAFWDGGRRWKVRYSPEQTGSYRWRTLWPDASESGFHQKFGSFRVQPYRGRNELYRHGAPRISSNRRHFMNAGGRPWFFLSDTVWNGALLSTREEWRQYLADRARKKFTAAQFVMTQWRAGRQDERGQVAFTGAESIRINPAFFERMDEKVDAVNDHGLVAVPVLLWALTSKEKESPGESLSTGQAILLARYMVARYGAHHVIWFLGGDGDYRGEKAGRWKEIGRAVFPARHARRPVTLHPRGMQSPWAEFRDEPWLDFFLYQSGHGNDARKWRWNATEGGAADWKMQPARPVMDGEINYEGHLDYHTRQVITDAQVRRAAWYSLLAAPPAGVSYGAHGVWFWSRRAEVPLDHPRSGVAQPWHQSLDFPGARQMTVLREVFESLAWWKLRPDRSLLGEEPEDPEFRRYIMPARSESGDPERNATGGEFALLYLPDNPVVKLDLTKFRGRWKATWIDPRNGRRHKAQAAAEMKSPGPGDWVLLLRK